MVQTLYANAIPSIIPINEPKIATKLISRRKEAMTMFFV